jgi:hypothetical protein
MFPIIRIGGSRPVKQRPRWRKTLQCQYDGSMELAYQAALNVTRESFAMMSDALNGLPPEALAWKPIDDANTIAVLVAHSITATRFWMDAAAGRQRSMVEYRAGERAESFLAAAADAADLQRQIDAYQVELARDLGAASAADLLRVAHWPDVNDAPRASGYECLQRAIGHLREHVGQVQLIRDLWLARG